MEPPHDGRSRVVIENVRPCIDGGQFPIKRTVGEEVEVSADVFADGHDFLSCVLLYRPQDRSAWQEVTMTPQYSDRWIGRFPVTVLTRYHYTIEGWIDHFQTWQHALQKRVKAGQDV